MSAYKELIEYLDSDENVEGIVFGAWGWGSIVADKFTPGFGEPNDPLPVPADLRGKVLTLKQAKKYMATWSFDNGFGSPECYATCVWTNKRVIWVTQYDGSTGLDSMPRNPVNFIPYMPGG